MLIMVRRETKSDMRKIPRFRIVHIAQRLYLSLTMMQIDMCVPHIPKAKYSYFNYYSIHISDNVVVQFMHLVISFQSLKSMQLNHSISLNHTLPITVCYIYLHIIFPYLIKEE